MRPVAGVGGRETVSGIARVDLYSRLFALFDQKVSTKTANMPSEAGGTGCRQDLSVNCSVWDDIMSTGIFLHFTGTLGSFQFASIIPELTVLSNGE